MNNIGILICLHLLHLLCVTSDQGVFYLKGDFSSDTMTIWCNSCKCHVRAPCTLPHHVHKRDRSLFSRQIRWVRLLFLTATCPLVAEPPHACWEHSQSPVFSCVRHIIHCLQPLRCMVLIQLQWCCIKINIKSLKISLSHVDLVQKPPATTSPEFTWNNPTGDL